MTTACPAIAYGDSFVAGALNNVDCQARAIASLGYQALAAPGSDISLLITGLLTLAVAIIGYRLMMGETPSVRDGVLTLAKFGLVLALAGSWATYRTLAYDVVLQTPAELVATVGGAAGLPGASGDLTARLQLVDQGLAQLGEAGIGKRETGGQVMRVRNVNGRSETFVESARGSVSILEPIALGLARLLFLVSAIGGMVVVRLVAAILLALGPLFVAFLLFDTTRGWFAGWLRGLAATVIGAFGVAILLGIELALLEPWLVGLLTLRAADQTIAGAPVELLAATLIFALTILGMLAAATRVAGGFRFPEAWRAMPARWGGQFEERVRDGRSPPAAAEQAAERPRVAAVADAIAATQRREAAATMAPFAAVAATSGGGGGGPSRVPAIQSRSVELPGSPPPPLGQSLGRRTRNRVSASRGRRDMQ